MSTRNDIKENWEFYIEYSKENYPDEYKDMEFDISQKKWLTKAEMEEKNKKRKSKAEIKSEDRINAKEKARIKKEEKAKIKMEEKEKNRKHKITPRTLKEKEFHKIRDLIFERDDFKCVECGDNYMIGVHHIKEMSKGGSNSPSNLITLCYACHTKKHIGEPVHRMMKTWLKK